MLADSALRRMRGLLGRKTLDSGHGILIRPAPAIHTWFMRFAIDAVFLDPDLSVLSVRRELRPWRMAGQRAHAPCSSFRLARRSGVASSPATGWRSALTVSDARERRTLCHCGGRGCSSWVATCASCAWPQPCSRSRAIRPVLRPAAGAPGAGAQTADRCGCNRRERLGRRGGPRGGLASRATGPGSGGAGGRSGAELARRGCAVDLEMGPVRRAVGSHRRGVRVAPRGRAHDRLGSRDQAL